MLDFGYIDAELSGFEAYIMECDNCADEVIERMSSMDVEDMVEHFEEICSETGIDWEDLTGLAKQKIIDYIKSRG